jgi:hypothetical protein
MDLKFRSDLLGRAVLFMGYSFRDINIRVIWFKLMEMMKDVPVKDRPPSYIVRLAPNPVLDALYEAVGLQTIIIDPDGQAETSFEKTGLLEQFMLELSMRADSNARIPGTAESMFISPILLNRIESAIEELESPSTIFMRSRSTQGRPDRAVPSADLLALIEQLGIRELSPHHRERAIATANLIARRVELRSSAAALISLAKKFGGFSSGVTYMVADALMRFRTRSVLLREDLEWEQIWSKGVDMDDANALIEGIRMEINGHVRGTYRDEDVAYAVDLAQRIARGDLQVEDQSGDLMEEVQQLLTTVADIYPAATKYEPPSGAPKPTEICNEIARRIREEEEEEEETEDES